MEKCGKKSIKYLKLAEKKKWVLVIGIKESVKKKIGYELDCEQYVDMVTDGILDPAKVTRSALQNATSVASTFLTTESAVANIKEDVPAMPAGGAGMGMM